MTSSRSLGKTRVLTLLSPLGLLGQHVGVRQLQARARARASVSGHSWWARDAGGGGGGDRRDGGCRGQAGGGVNRMACCEPALAVAAEDAARGGSWERRVNRRAIRDDFRPPVERPLSLQSWMSCVLSSESKSAVRRSGCVPCSPTSSARSVDEGSGWTLFGGDSSSSSSSSSSSGRFRFVGVLLRYLVALNQYK